MLFRWKPLEAVLALLGGISDDIRGLLEDDEDKGRPRTVDIPALLDSVIPGLLDQVGEYKQSIPRLVDLNDLRRDRHAFPSRPSISLYVAVCFLTTRKPCKPVSRSCSDRYGVAAHCNTRQDIRSQDYQEVSRSHNHRAIKAHRRS
jgi:hypothetical protein